MTALLHALKIMIELSYAPERRMESGNCRDVRAGRAIGRLPRRGGDAMIGLDLFERTPSMAATSIRAAETDADFDAARDLCRAWVDWQLKVFPHMRDKILAKFEPVEYARTLADLPMIHARPKGAILLASLSGAPVGCVMYDEMEPGVAEIKRLFVEEAGRGHGLGRTLLTSMMAQMRSDGYATVRFSSARFLTHARALYESVGFVDIPHPADFPAKLRDVAYFMERRL
jgi:GNAT superfamily N-acetyltransferase